MSTTRTPMTADERVAALQARRAAAAAPGRHRHAAHGARIFTAIAAGSSVFGLAGIMALATTGTTTSVAASAAATSASTSAASTATNSATSSLKTATTATATPTTQASTSSHGS